MGCNINVVFLISHGQLLVCNRITAIDSIPLLIFSDCLLATEL